MERIGVRELRQHASRYLAPVANGDTRMQAAARALGLPVNPPA